MKRLLSFFIFSLILSLSPLAQAGWIEDGSFGPNDQIWLDDKIKPVSDGATVYPWIYTFSHKISIQNMGYVYKNYIVDLQTGYMAQLPGKTQMLTLNTRETYIDEVESKWEVDSEGLNAWTYAAYLWHNKEKVERQKPVIMPAELQKNLTDRNSRWEENNNQWLSVFEKENGQKAFIQTDSIIFFNEPDASLPGVQVFIRWEEVKNDKLMITYSLERYSLANRTRTFIARWSYDNQHNAIETMELPVKTVYPARVPDETTSVATATYLYDLFHNKKARTLTELPDNTLELVDYKWFTF